MNRFSVCIVVKYCYWLFCLFLLAKTIDCSDLECVPLSSCPSIKKMVNFKNAAPEIQTFLKYSYCGHEHDEEVKVWCIFKPCKTPDTKPGFCRNIKDCKPFLNLIKTVDVTHTLTLKYLQEFECERFSYNDQVQICCPLENKFPDFPKTTVINEPDITTTNFPTTTYNLIVDKSEHTNMLPNASLGQCGAQQSGEKLTSGSEAALGEFPWMARITYKRNDGSIKHGCGGSLISDKYVLTAAHCVDDHLLEMERVGKLYSIILGDHDIADDPDCSNLDNDSVCAPPVQEFNIKSIILHPLYNISRIQASNDIALIELDKPVKISEYVKPICLPTGNLSFKSLEESKRGTKFLISGWGLTQNGFAGTSIKMKGSVPYRHKQICNELSKQLNATSLSDSQICAGDGNERNNGTDTCKGDSGGPLMYNTLVDYNIITYLVGVTSYGFPRYRDSCGRNPTVYTYVPLYLDWIIDNVVQKK